MLHRKHNALEQQYNELKKNVNQKVQRAVDDKAAEMQKEIDEKDKIIAQLRAQLNNDSTNSGISTSKTPIGKKKRVPNSRKKTGRKKGGQKGHPKHKLEAFDDDQIDKTVVHEVKPDVCNKCGGSLETVDETYKDEYVLKVIVEHVRHKFVTKKCKDCGKTFRVEIPNSLKEENQYGSSVQSLALILINKGYIAKIQKRLASKLGRFDDDLKRYVISMPLLHWDDTGSSIGENNAILRFYGDESVAFYRAHMHKDMKSLDEDGLL